MLYSREPDEIAKELKPQEKHAAHGIADQRGSFEAEDSAREVMVELHAQVPLYFVADGFGLHRTDVTPELARDKPGMAPDEGGLLAGDAMKPRSRKLVQTVGKRAVPCHNLPSVAGPGTKRNVVKCEIRLFDEADRADRFPVRAQEQAVKMADVIMPPAHVVRIFEPAGFHLGGQVVEIRKPRPCGRRARLDPAIQREPHPSHSGEDFQPGKKEPCRGENKTRQDTSADEPSGEKGSPDQPERSRAEKNGIAKRPQRERERSRSSHQHDLKKHQGLI